MALRAFGRFNDTTVISPACGALIVDNLIGEERLPPDEVL